MEPGVRPAWAAMRGMVVPAMPCWPRTSAAALRSLRSDSRLRACWGSKARVLDFAGVLLNDFRGRGVASFIVLFYTRVGGRWGAERCGGGTGREGRGLAGRPIWGICAGRCVEVGSWFFKMERDSTFVMNAAPNCVDVRGAGSQASCCGVNLACAELSVLRLGAGGFGFGG